MIWRTSHGLDGLFSFLIEIEIICGRFFHDTVLSNVIVRNRNLLLCDGDILHTLPLSQCHCNEKIVNPILNAEVQHFQMHLNGVFSFSLSHFVLEIFRFSKHAN